MTGFRFLAAVGVAVLAMPAVLHAQQVFATMAEFKAGIVGKAMTSTTSKGQPFTATIKSGGTGDFQIEGKPLEHFKWKFTGNKFCWTFPYLTECSHVEIAGPNSANFVDAKSGKLNNAYSLQ